MLFERNGRLIEKKFMQYLLSTILMSMALSLGTIVDGILASHFIGINAVAAINTCQPVVLVFGALYSIFGAGGSTLSATALGKGDRDRANYFFTMSIGMLFVLGILVTIGILPFLDTLIGAVTAGSTLGPMAKDYLSVLVYGAVVLFVVPGLSFFIRSDGHPTLAALILVVANVVNLVCDAIFMGILKVGIKGSALATVVGYLVGLFMTVPYFISKKRSFHLSLRYIKLSYIKEIFICGLPNALSSILMTVKMLCLNRMVISLLGDNGASAVAICNNCLSFASIFIGGSAQTMLPIIGVLYGENDKNGMIMAFKKALRIVIVAGIVMVVIFEFFPQTVAALFGVNSPELMNICKIAIRLFGISLPVFAVVYVYMTYYQATEKRAFAISITVCEGLVFIVPLIFILGTLFPANGIGVWISFLISELMSLGLILITGFIIARKLGKESILLFEPDNDATFDITVKTSIENAIEASKSVMEFCRQNGIEGKRVNACGLAIEEMLTNTVKYGYKDNTDKDIDLIVRKQNDDLIIRIRDNGKPFDPFEYTARDIDGIGFRISGIELLKSMTKSAEYSRNLGFNNLIIRV